MQLVPSSLLALDVSTTAPAGCPSTLCCWFLVAWMFILAGTLRGRWGRATDMIPAPWLRRSQGLINKGVPLAARIAPRSGQTGQPRHEPLLGSPCSGLRECERQLQSTPYIPKMPYARRLIIASPPVSSTAHAATSHGASATELLLAPRVLRGPCHSNVTFTMGIHESYTP
jgi:hypothetical protein